ncbi:hypothetical protein B0H11DRAFT_2292061 [Mycena galericulata]|nr:hypothetical protein B0H11DRAFT_2292061 [Mycena galericulata]
MPKVGPHGQPHQYVPWAPPLDWGPLGVFIPDVIYTPTCDYARDQSPTASELMDGTHATIHKRIITYSRHDRKRFAASRAADRAALEGNHAATISRPKSTDTATHPRRKSWALIPAMRRSRRLRQARVGDSTIGGYETGEAMTHMDPNVVYLKNDHLRPMVDTRNRVIAVFSAAPQGHPYWPALIDRATRDMSRVHFQGDFTHLGEAESYIRVGMDYGQRGAFPHRAENSALVISRAKRGKRDLRDLRMWTQVRSIRKKTGGSPVGCSRNTTARKGERTV